MNALTIKKLNKTYANGTQALRSVDLEIAQGDFYALLGANGAGKTTLIGIVTGLVNKTSGEVTVFEHNIDKNFSQAKRLIGVVPQEMNFSIFDKVQDILITQAGYFGIPREEALPQVEVLLKKLALWEKRTFPSRTLSGGMKRRLMIARALVHRPRFLILDEPTAGVDVEIRHEMWDYLRELNRQGTTILLTTHYLEEVEQMCRYAAIIKNGQIIKQDTVKRLVQLLDKVTYVVTVKSILNLEQLKKFNPVATDQNIFEIEIDQDETLQEFISGLNQTGMSLLDIHPHGHRLEKLFLKILKE